MNLTMPDAPVAQSISVGLSNNNSQTVEVVDTFLYLGSLITSDAECTTDIRARLNKGPGIVSPLRKIWKSHDITTDIKVPRYGSLLQSLVWPVAIYGCESWTMKRSDENRFEAFEMKAIRQIL